jgi:hypothetical protein
MLEIVFGLLSTLGDIVAPTPAVRWFWAVFALMLLILAMAAIAKASA